MHFQTGIINYFIQDLEDIEIGWLETFLDVFSDLGDKVNDLVSNFLVSFGQDEAWIFLYFLIELLDNLTLIKISCFWLIEHCRLLSLLNVDQPDIVKDLFQELRMAEMIKILLDHFRTLRGLGVQRMRFREYNGRKLHQKVLKANKIKLLRFPLIQQLNINIPNQIMNLVIISQEEQFVIFQKFDRLDQIQSLFPYLIIFEIVHTLDRVH